MPRLNKNIRWIFVLLLCVLPVFAQNNQKRFALVIGNNSYQAPNDLKNPVSDALDISLVLYDMDFEVIRAFNQTKSQTEILIDSFANKLAQTKGIGLIYYSGIGIQSNGENYLVPVDAGFESAENTVKTSVSVNFLLSKLKNTGNKLNLILLDPKRKYNSPVKWKNYSINTYNQGFVKVSPPENSAIVYSADFYRTADELCGRNGYFAAAFLKQLEKPNLEFNQLIKNVAAEVSLKTNNRQKVFLDGVLTKYFFLVDKKHKLRVKEKKSLAELFENFKSEGKCPCGQRDDVLTFGKKIIEKFGNDKVNVNVIVYVKKQISIIEKEDPLCRRYDRYNTAYKTKNWKEFFSVSNEIMATESDTPLGFNVLLTLVSVGYNRAVVEKIDTYNNETFRNAQTALQKLEANKPSTKYGVFEAFKTKQNAQSWMNYIIGYLMYEKMNRKEEALPYYYKATQIGTENKDDVSIYVKIGNNYFEKASALFTKYTDRLKAVNNKENDETEKLLGLARATAERAIDAYGRAYKFALKSVPQKKTLPVIRKNLEDSYKLRFNIAPDVKPEGIDIYFEKLISQPMPDPSTEVKPILQ